MRFSIAILVLLAASAQVQGRPAVDKTASPAPAAPADVVHLTPSAAQPATKKTKPVPVPKAKITSPTTLAVTPPPAKAVEAPAAQPLEEKPAPKPKAKPVPAVPAPPADVKEVPAPAAVRADKLPTPEAKAKALPAAQEPAAKAVSPPAVTATTAGKQPKAEPTAKAVAATDKPTVNAREVPAAAPGAADEPAVKPIKPSSALKTRTAVTVPPAPAHAEHTPAAAAPTPATAAAAAAAAAAHSVNKHAAPAPEAEATSVLPRAPAESAVTTPVQAIEEHTGTTPAARIPCVNPPNLPGFTPQDLAAANLKWTTACGPGSTGAEELCLECTPGSAAVDENSLLLSRPAVQCVEGQWQQRDVQPPVCKRPCAAAPEDVPQGSALKCNTPVPHGDTCSAQCTGVYQSAAVQTWQCNNGAWELYPADQPELICSSNSKTGPKPAVVAGAVIGSLAALTLLGTLCFLITECLRRRKRTKSQPRISSSSSKDYDLYRLPISTPICDSPSSWQPSYNNSAKSSPVVPKNWTKAQGSLEYSPSHKLEYSPSRKLENSPSRKLTVTIPTSLALATAGSASYSDSSEGGNVAGFTVDHLRRAMEYTAAKVNRLVTRNLRPGATSGAAQAWLLHGLNAARSTVNSPYGNSDRLKEDWATNTVWKWLHTHVWAAKHPLVAAVQQQAAHQASGRRPTSATRAQAARDLLRAVQKDPSHSVFEPTANSLTQQLRAAISSHTVDDTQLAIATRERHGSAGVSALIEAALLLQLQALGTSGGAQVFVPGASVGRGDDPSTCNVTYDDMGVLDTDRTLCLCTKPGVYDPRAPLRGDQNTTLLPAHAARYGLEA